MYVNHKTWFENFQTTKFRSTRPVSPNTQSEKRFSTTGFLRNEYDPKMYFNIASNFFPNEHNR